MKQNHFPSTRTELRIKFTTVTTNAEDKDIRDLTRGASLDRADWTARSRRSDTLIAVRELVRFATAVAKNWGSIVTSGVLIGVISIWQTTGRYIPRWIYWFIASLGLLRAFYRTWLSERQAVLALTTQLTSEKVKLKGELERSEELRRQITGLAERTEDENKKELIKAITLLHSMQSEVMYWRDILKDKWGIAPPRVKLLPDEWSTVLCAAENISGVLRMKADVLEGELVKANSLIAQFLNMPVSSRDLGLIPPAYNLLDQAVPHLFSVTTEFEEFEKSSRSKMAREAR